MRRRRGPTRSWARAALLFGFSALPWPAAISAHAGATVAFTPLGPGRAFHGRPIELAVWLVAEDPELAVGSYAWVLDWDPSCLGYVSHRPGEGETLLSQPVVQTANAAAGRLAASAADPSGAGGIVESLRVSFDVLAATGQTCVVTGDFTSLYEAGSFRDLLPFRTVEPDAIPVRDPHQSLDAEESPAGTAISWVPVPGATSYDVARGRVEHLATDGVFIALGELLCIENDSPDTTTGSGHEDADIPEPGTAFFYLVRPTGEGYGASSGGEIRQPDAGDCPIP